MRKLLCLFFFICSLMGTLESEASVKVILTIQDELSQGEYEEPDDPSERGRRSAPVPVYCTIDFDNNTISGDSLLEEVTEYQVWDENGECCLLFASDAYSFVESLKSLPFPETYMIVLKTSNSSLVGYIDLE